jgi:GT2 family glycosyltransferase
LNAASIVIPAWNGVTWIADCLRSIEPQRRPGDEVIVVDNGSTDGTPNLVARDFPQARLIRLERNLGFAGGVNRGLEAARGDVLVLVNQDVTLREGCLDALRWRIDESGPAIVGCKLLYPDGRTIQHAGGIIYYPRAEPNHRGYRQIDDGRWDSVEQVDYVSGAVFAFSRAVLRTIGSFDEGFFPAYYEEVDYCFRARAAGFAVIYEPAAVAVHHESQSLDVGSPAYRQAMQRGRLRFILKNYPLEGIGTEFFPAEEAYLASVPPSFAREALAPAYFDALLRLPDLSRTVFPLKTDEARLTDAMAVGLAELYVRARHLPAALENAMNEHSHSFHLPTLHEHDFRSNVPIVGSLIGLVRRSLYSLTAKWGVWAVISQQNHINQTIVQYLIEQRRYVDQLEARLIEQDRDLTQLGRTVAELNIRHRYLAKQLRVQTGVAPGDEPRANTGE